MNRKQILIDINKLEKEKEEAIKICNEFKNILQLGSIYFTDSQTQEVCNYSLLIFRFELTFQYARYQY
jgi:hypothetical protein